MTIRTPSQEETSRNCDGPARGAHRGVILSLFPGIDLFGRGFEAEGFCVVRGPDLIFGGDIRGFHVPSSVISGIIGGSPCQEFSGLFRGEVTGYSVEMLNEFLRVVGEAQPDWFLLENVPRVPTVTVDGYRMQRIDLDAREVGSQQRRLRHFQFGSRHGMVITVTRQAVTAQVTDQAAHRTALAWEGRHGNRRGWPEFCQLQGLPRDFSLPSFTRQAAYRAVGNGVPVPMARALAKAVLAARHWSAVKLCACSCGREVTGRAILATVACRQRVSRRNRDAAGVTNPGPVTGAESLLNL